MGRPILASFPMGGGVGVEKSWKGICQNIQMARTHRYKVLTYFGQVEHLLSGNEINKNKLEHICEK